MKKLKEQSLLKRKTSIYRWHIRANRHRPDIIEDMEKKIKEITKTFDNSTR